MKMRNPLKKEEEKPQVPAAPEKQEEAQPVQVVEREVTLSLLNDKLNYATGLLHKIAEAAEIKLD